MYTEMNAACGSAGNEATVDYVLLNLCTWVVPETSITPPRLATGPFLQVKYAQGLYIFFMCEVVQIF